MLSAHPGTAIDGGLERYLARLQEWHDAAPMFDALGYDIAFVSAQPFWEQGWLAWARFELVVLSDARLELASSLCLETLPGGGRPRYADVTIVTHGGEVTAAVTPAPAPQEEVREMLRFLRCVQS